MFFFFLRSVCPFRKRASFWLFLLSSARERVCYRKKKNITQNILSSKKKKKSFLFVFRFFVEATICSLYFFLLFFSLLSLLSRLLVSRGRERERHREPQGAFSLPRTRSLVWQRACRREGKREKNKAKAAVARFRGGKKDDREERRIAPSRRLRLRSRPRAPLPISSVDG